MQRREFNHRGQFKVLRPFRFAGRDHKMGDLFLHRQLSVDPRKLRVLWDARKIDMLDPFSEAAQEAEQAAELEALEAELDLDADEA